MKYLTHYTEAAQTELFKKYGAFFAFSDSQFDEQKKEGVVYVSLKFGLIAPKKNANKVMRGVIECGEKGRKADIEENGKEGVIKRELANHECYYTLNVDNCLKVLSKYDITSQEVAKIFQEQLLLREKEIE